MQNFGNNDYGSEYGGGGGGGDGYEQQQQRPQQSQKYVVRPRVDPEAEGEVDTSL